MSGPESLVERLLNPMWSHGPSDGDVHLDVEATTADMREAAAELSTLRSRCDAAEYARDEWKASHGRVVEGFMEVCEAVGVQFDAPEAVAYAINAKNHNAIAARDAALKPFADMAGEMFARGWDASNVALALDNPDDPHRVTAGDFFRARATQPAGKEKTK